MKNLAKKIGKLLNNDVVFAVAVLFAFLNVSGYIFVRSYECLAVFVAVACVSNYFSKNYVVDIIAAIFVANFVFGCGRISREGFQEGEENEDEEVMSNMEGMADKAKAKKEGAGEPKKDLSAMLKDLQVKSKPKSE